MNAPGVPNGGLPQAPSASVDTPRTAHERLHASFLVGRTLPRSFRMAQLCALRDFLSSQESDLFSALHSDLHKPRLESLLYDLGPLYFDIAHLIHNLSKLTKPKRLRRELGAAVHIEPHPKGIVLVLGPFNFPIQLLLRPVVAAIAAGNAVCVKPSELAPASEAFLLRVCEVLDPQTFAIIPGGPDVAQELLSFKWDHIMFTGSGRIGKLVMKAAAEQLTPVTLELGGKNPAIVTSSAHVETAAASIVRSRFINCGQNHCFVEDAVYDTFLSAVTEKIREFYTDDPKTCPGFGRLISSSHFRHVTSLLDASKGRVRIGGERNDEDQHFVAPTVVEVDSAEDSLLNDEIFGPVLPILRISSVDDAIRLVNEGDIPLALYLFTRDRNITKKVLPRTRSGSAGVNETILQIAQQGSFLGGVGDSGMGAYGFSKGFETFSHFRPVMYSAPFWSKMMAFIQPNYSYPGPNGKERRGIESLIRLASRAPRRGGRPPFHEQAKNVFRVTSGCVAAVLAVVLGICFAKRGTSGSGS